MLAPLDLGHQDVLAPLDLGHQDVLVYQLTGFVSESQPLTESPWMLAL